MTQTTGLPRWDLTVVYPSLDSSEFAVGFEGVVSEIRSLQELFDQYAVERRADATVTAETVRAFDRVTERFNAVLDETQTLYTYVSCTVAADTRDPNAQAKLSALQQHTVILSKLGTRFTAWIGSLDIEALLEQSEIARAHAYTLRRAKISAEHMMSPPEEELAAELNLSGGSAWSKLHMNVSSQISVNVELDGETKTLPMSAVRNLAFDARREVRQRAYHAELAAWQANAVPLAAALNGIKGQVNTLRKRRKWDSALDQALFEAAIDRAILDAMLTAAREAFPDLRRYLRAKARALGLEKLAWYDIFAPVGSAAREWTFEEARDFILTHFGSYSDTLRRLAERAFRDNWIDAEPRPGKRDGAFCASLRGEESRILSNYKAAYAGMNTLAHELGHAYHNLIKAPRTPLQRDTPMTLAETASTFCETIVREAALAQADKNERMSILEASLQDSCQVIVDISSRFLFESRVFERRGERELSANEFCELMLSAQRETYGDGLDETQLHPYMWAVKPHYYSSGISFYNFPYMFGLLFGLGLYARYRQNPEEFKKGYDELLSSTGMADAATLASRFGIDLAAPDFWRSSLALVRADVDRFESLV